MTEKKIYTEKDFTILDDAVAVVRKRPDIYLGCDPEFVPYSLIQSRLTSGLVTDILLLRANPMLVDFVDDLIVISSPNDWMRMGEAESFETEELFSRIVGLPEAGQNSMRSEITLNAFAQKVVVLKKMESTIIKGRFTDGTLTKLRNYEPDSFKVAFE